MTSLSEQNELNNQIQNSQATTNENSGTNASSASGAVSGSPEPNNISNASVTTSQNASSAPRVNAVDAAILNEFQREAEIYAATLTTVLQNLQSDDLGEQLACIFELNELLLMDFQFKRVRVSISEIVRILSFLIETSCLEEIVGNACRALAQMLNISGSYSANMLDVIPALLQKAIIVEEDDLSTQALTCLEKLSKKHGQNIIANDGVTVCLKHYQFYNAQQKQKAVSIIFYACKWLTAEDENSVKNFLPFLTDALSYKEKEHLEKFSACFSIVVNRFRNKPLLGEIATPECISTLLNIVATTAGFENRKSLLKEIFSILTAFCSLPQHASLLTFLGALQVIQEYLISNDQEPSQGLKLKVKDVEELKYVLDFFNVLLPKLPSDELSKFNNICQLPGTNETSAEETAEAEVRKLGEEVTKSLFKIIYEIYSAMSTSHKRAYRSILVRLIYYGSSETVTDALATCKLYDVLVGMMESNQQDDVVCGLKIATLLLEKLPLTSETQLSKQGFVHHLMKYVVTKSDGNGVGQEVGDSDQEVEDGGMEVQDRGMEVQNAVNGNGEEKHGGMEVEEGEPSNKEEDDNEVEQDGENNNEEEEDDNEDEEVEDQRGGARNEEDLSDYETESEEEDDDVGHVVETPAENVVETPAENKTEWIVEQAMKLYSSHFEKDPDAKAFQGRFQDLLAVGKLILKESDEGICKFLDIFKKEELSTAELTDSGVLDSLAMFLNPSINQLEEKYKVSFKRNKFFLSKIMGLSENVPLETRDSNLFQKLVKQVTQCLGVMFQNLCEELSSNVKETATAGSKKSVSSPETPNDACPNDELFDLLKCAELGMLFHPEHTPSLSSNSFASVQYLLKILYTLNNNWGVFFGKISASPLLNPQEFVCNSVDSKIMEEVKNYLSTRQSLLPKLITVLQWYFFCKFETRRMLFHLMVIPNMRGLEPLKLELGINIESYPLQFPKMKKTIRRENLLDGSIEWNKEKVFSSLDLLEVQFEDEVGTGSGPTLEFFSMLSLELQKHNLKIWHGDPISEQKGTRLSGSESDLSPEKPTYSDSLCGLFPLPLMDPNSSFEEAVYFDLLGKVMAKSFIDNRVVDIPLSTAMFKWLSYCSSGKAKLGLGDLKDVLPPIVVKFTQELIDVVLKKRNIESNMSLTSEQKGHEIEKLMLTGASFEDLCIDFSLPGYPSIEMKEDGKNVMLTLDNAEEYLELMTKWFLRDGVEKQLKTFYDALTSVLRKYKNIVLFPDEVGRMFCGDNFEHWSPEYLCLHTECKNGYTHKSKTVQYLFEVLSTLTVEQQKLFVKFLTARTRLPVGGLKNLKPILKITRVSLQSGQLADDILPSTMTCFHNLKLPEYSSIEITREKLLLAITDGQSAFHLS